MIFNLVITTIMLSFMLFPLSTVTVENNNDWNSEDISQEEEIEAKPVNFDLHDDKYEEYKLAAPPDVQNFSLDLDRSGIDEKITIKSYPGSPGDQNTEIYINSDVHPIFTEVGTFYALNLHKMDNADNYVTELQLQTGQSLNALFYLYKNEKLERISVSTEDSPSWHGIISRNIPEFKDVDSDGVLELIVHYNFLHDRTRTVEVYEYNGLAFNLIQKYEEEAPTVSQVSF